MHETPSLHRDLIDGRVRLARVGAVVAGTTPSLPWFVVDAAGREVEPVSRYMPFIPTAFSEALRADVLQEYRQVRLFDCAE
ncbi:hypothetical protein ABT269_20790 [Streptomyces viridosporus]|uniref:hypothetical protein n=1 Tax=Streptomyces viridosporus TaxID=67581 RepID=UPI00333307F3